MALVTWVTPYSYPLAIYHVSRSEVVSHGMCVQVEAHHYCGHLNEEVRQCVIYDSGEDKARLIGIEYIISRRLFESLPEEEKKMWHSHQYEASTVLAPSAHQPFCKQLHNASILSAAKQPIPNRGP